MLTDDYHNAVKSLYEITDRALSKIPKRKVNITNRDPIWKIPVIKDMEKKRSHVYASGDEDAFKSLNSEILEQIEISRRNHVQKLGTGSRAWWKEANRTLKPSNSKLDHFVRRYDSVEKASEAYNDDLLNRFEPSDQLSDVNFIDHFATFGNESVEVENHDVVLAINSLKTSSAPGLDQVSAWFLKHFAVHYIVPLCYIYNLSLKNGKFHEMWKVGVVVPMPKCDKPTAASDLRPLSLTSVFAKVFEKIIYAKTKNFWQSIIGSDQFAYRPLCSTTSALTLMTHNWLDFLDKNKNGMICVLAIDFAKHLILSIMHFSLVSCVVMEHPYG